MSAAAIQLRYAIASTSTQFPDGASPSAPASEPPALEGTANGGRWSSGAGTAVAVIMSLTLFMSAFLAFLLCLRNRKATAARGKDDSALVPQDLRDRERNEETVFPKPQLKLPVAIMSTPGSLQLSELAVTSPRVIELNSDDNLAYLPKSSDNGSWPHPARSIRNNHWGHPYELAATNLSRTSLVSSGRSRPSSARNGNNPAGTLENLQAKRATITAERERLHRVEIFRDEEQWLSTVIAEMEGLSAS
ncbi:hypothetical protein CC86DRAFT_399889 [Ophiobolus disseminans]|uniref:Uncharacterized protein n=1 Tax=Ophiobolus disseminans TaxID=1469910 RepID=A0A6A7AKK0_9PLEO|nr:hypothetical protein CC86DRAFT_399889 [Ophiobolus disseminans]